MQKIKEKWREWQMNKRLINLFMMVVAFGIYGFVQITFVVPKHKTITTEYGFLLFTSVVIAITVIWFAYFLSLQKQNDWGFHYIYGLDLKALAFIIGGFLLILIVQISVTNLGKGISNNQNTLETIFKKSNPIFLIMISLIAPICEELIFRGFFFQVFFTKPSTLNLVLGAIVNGIVFAFAHDTHLDIFWLDYWFTGFIFSLQYLYTKNISTSMITHIANNLLAII